MGREGKSIVQFVPADPNKTAHVLDAAGSSSTKREVLILRVLDEPGVVLGVGDLVGAAQVAGMTLE